MEMRSLSPKLKGQFRIADFFGAFFACKLVERSLPKDRLCSFRVDGKNRNRIEKHHLGWGVCFILGQCVKGRQHCFPRRMLQSPGGDSGLFIPLLDLLAAALSEGS